MVKEWERSDLCLPEDEHTDESEADEERCKEACALPWECRAAKSNRDEEQDQASIHEEDTSPVKILERLHARAVADTQTSFRLQRCQLKSLIHAEAVGTHWMIEKVR